MSPPPLLPPARVCMYVCVCVYVCIYTDVHVCVYAPIALPFSLLSARSLSVSDRCKCIEFVISVFRGPIRASYVRMTRVHHCSIQSSCFQYSEFVISVFREPIRASYVRMTTRTHRHTSSRLSHVSRLMTRKGRMKFVKVSILTTHSCIIHAARPHEQTCS